MYEKLIYGSSEELCRGMANECDTCVLAFSTGKDSVAAWLQLRKYFRRIIPYYCYLIPGLQFVEESLEYYEDFFQTRIFRFPHRTFWRFLEDEMFQTPDNAMVLGDMPLLDYTDADLGEDIRVSGGLPEGTYTANGVRMADSPMRRIAIKTHGAINHNTKTFYPVYDWKKEDMLRELRQSGVKLPIDYQLFGRTFDGLDYRFLKPLKEHFPEDYQRILEWFPLAEAEIFRRENV